MNDGASTALSNLFSRRKLLVNGSILAAGRAFGQSANATTSKLAGIRALIFDVYGSSTDHRGTIVREGESINQSKGLQIDWGRFADNWRALCQPGFDAVVSGKDPWRSCTVIRREALERLLTSRKVTFTETELAQFNLVWQRVEPWPDVLPGLQRLKQQYTLAALSNADMATLVNMAKLRNLPWDVILSGELVRNFKPNALVYDMVPAYLALQPSQLLMVSCHNFDLWAAKGRGFRTAFVARPLELGSGGKVDSPAGLGFDVIAADFGKLADQLTNA